MSTNKSVYVSRQRLRHISFQWECLTRSRSMAITQQGNNHQSLTPSEKEARNVVGGSFGDSQRLKLKHTCEDLHPWSWLGLDPRWNKQCCLPDRRHQIKCNCPRKKSILLVMEPCVPESTYSWFIWCTYMRGYLLCFVL